MSRWPDPGMLGELFVADSHFRNLFCIINQSKSARVWLDTFRDVLVLQKRGPSLRVIRIVGTVR